MDLERMTSTGRVTTKGRPSHSSRTTVGMFLGDLQQFPGRVLQVVLESKPPVHLSSPSPTCMESSPQSSLSRMRMMGQLLLMEVVMDLNLGVTTLTFTPIATQTQARIRVSQIDTTTRQEKGGAFSQAAQVQILSQSKKSKYSEPTFKTQKLKEIKHKLIYLNHIDIKNNNIYFISKLN